jgi:hypothetical protein
LLLLNVSEESQVGRVKQRIKSAKSLPDLRQERRMASAGSRAAGAQRVLVKLQESLSNEKYYEAHQMYRTLYFRYVTSDCSRFTFSRRFFSMQIFKSKAVPRTSRLALRWCYKIVAQKSGSKNTFHSSSTFDIPVVCMSSLLCLRM